MRTMHDKDVGTGIDGCMSERYDKVSGLIVCAGFGLMSMDGPDDPVRLTMALDDGVYCCGKIILIRVGMNTRRISDNIDGIVEAQLSAVTTSATSTAAFLSIPATAPTQ